MIYVVSSAFCRTPVKRSNVASSNNNNNHIKVEDGSTPLDSIFNEIQAFDSVHKTHVNVKREAKLEKLKRNYFANNRNSFGYLRQCFEFCKIFKVYNFP